MDVKLSVSRRGFVGGVTGALGLLTLDPRKLLSQVASAAPRPQRASADEYDLLAKLANNENPYGPPESVLQAMTKAFKYANRYGYPDGGIVETIVGIRVTLGTAGSASADAGSCQPSLNRPRTRLR